MGWGDTLMNSRCPHLLYLESSEDSEDFLQTVNAPVFRAEAFTLRTEPQTKQDNFLFLKVAINILARVWDDHILLVSY